MNKLVKAIKFFIPFYCFLLLGGLSSCQFMFKKLYGVKKIEKFDEGQYRKTLNQLVSKYDSTLCVSHIGTESEFMEYRTLDQDNKKDLSQPIQILYFYDDELKSFHVNCYAKGSLLGKLNWNYFNQFETYFPTSSVESIIENNTVKLSTLNSIYKIDQLNDNHRECIVFFWVNSLKKQSLIAFDTIVQNIRQHVNNKDEYPLIVLINNDQFFISLE